MKYFRSTIMVTGDAYVDLNDEVHDRSEDIIKLFTDEELEEEIEKRKNGKSKCVERINSLQTDIYNVDVTVDANDVLDEIDNEDLIEEITLRNLQIKEIIDVEKHELRSVICNTLDINELYSDEEIFDMLKEIWRIRR